MPVSLSLIQFLGDIVQGDYHHPCDFFNRLEIKSFSKIIQIDY